MSLVNAFTTPLTGDSYCTVADADAALIWSDAWTILTTQQKEDRIKAASAKADQRRFFGSKADPAQAMQFPRTFLLKETTDSYFGTEAQERSLKNYVLALLEYWLSKVPVGVQSYTLGDESIRHTAMTEPDEARNCLWDFWDA